MNEGWPREKRERFEEALYNYLDRCYINSKDSIDPICLGRNLYWGQKHLISRILDGLEHGVHRFLVLKARQLGISTNTRAISAFWLGVHRGLKGALVFDTAPHRDQARRELVTMIKELPNDLKFPRIITDNREGLILENDSKILFMSAGVKKSKGSGTLGRSADFAMAHMSELCSYENPEGMIAFDQALSEINPNRLYIEESTARGYNFWKDRWDAALEDPEHCECIFLGWWSKDSQRIDRNERDFETYGLAPPTPAEAEKIALVKKKYNFDITQEQLAWVRRKYDPSSEGGDVEAAEEVSAEQIQEQPWDDSEAFQLTGATFFQGKVLEEIVSKHEKDKFKAYGYQCGTEFWHTKIYEVRNPRTTEIRVWEEPEREAYYVVGVDPAYGTSEFNDCSCISIWRAYADGLDQVAEYSWPLVTTRQLAWVLASLLGWYGYRDSTIKYALELNGPGQAVFEEIKTLRRLIESGYRETEFQERGLRDMFHNVKVYVYSRMDSFTAGMSFHVKTNQHLKVTFLERFRDMVTSGVCRVRSMQLVEEMRRVTRSGDSISAPETERDDRVMSAAFAVHCWESGPRRQLISNRQTREAAEINRVRSTVTLTNLYQKNMLTAFFDQKKRVRQETMAQGIRRGWRGR